MKNNKAFIDTTVLTDRLLKRGDKLNNSQKAIEAFKETQLPVYAIKEFKAGPLYAYVWLHNKFILLNSFEKTIEQIHRMAFTPRKYLHRTALEALQTAANKTASHAPSFLESKYGANARQDKYLADTYRLSLKYLIISAWKKRRKIFTKIVNDLSCYVELAPIEKHGSLFLTPTKCTCINDKCCLSDIYREKVEELKLILHKLQELDPKPERQKQIKLLKEFIRKDKYIINEKSCRTLGDIFFVLFAPQDSIILTTNIADQRPLAETLKKNVCSPKEILTLE